MATKVTYISTTLPSDEQNAAFDAAVADVRRAVGTHQLIIGGTARPGGAPSGRTTSSCSCASSRALFSREVT
jgi:hypothetical protein